MAGKETLGEMALFEILGGAHFHWEKGGFSPGFGWILDLFPKNKSDKLTKPFVEMEDFQKPFQ